MRPARLLHSVIPDVNHFLATDTRKRACWPRSNQDLSI